MAYVVVSWLDVTVAVLSTASHGPGQPRSKAPGYLTQSAGHGSSQERDNPMSVGLAMKEDAVCYPLC